MLLTLLPICLVVLLYLRYQRLSSVPGPWLASFTDLWRAYSQKYYNITDVLLQLHKKYGSLVRIGPNTVSVSDAHAVSTIYTMHGEFIKADTYHPLRSFSNGAVRGSVIDIQNEKENSGLRRALGGVFSAKNVLDFEADLDIAIDALMDRLKRGGTDDIFETMQQFQIDFLMKIAFSEAPEFLKTGQSTVSWSFEARYRHWKSWQAVPKLEYLFYKSPLVTKFLKTTTPAWARMARERLQARESKGVIFSKGNDLLDKYMASREGHPELLDQGGLLRMVTSTISAGFDTTAFTMSTMLYYLLQNPSCLKELREELDGANLSDRPNWNEVHKLPYLDAVMKEAMRCYPFLDLLLERVVPRGGAQICGTFLPGGTVVGCDALVVHRDRGVFGDEVEAFMPERWLIDDPSRVLAMERAFLSFGSGKRVCLGRHLAGLEVKKLIPKLLNMFEVSLVNPNTKLECSDPHGLSIFPKPVAMDFTLKS